MNELVVLPRNEVVSGPTVVHAFNILTKEHRKVFRGEPGKTLLELAPKTNNPWVCLYNGNYVLRADMDFVPYADDHIAYLVLPLGDDGGVSQMIVGVVLIVVGAITGQGQLVLMGASMLLSGIMMPNYTPLFEANTQSPSPTYSLSVSGNSARLGGAIPVPYGRHLIVPDFVCQPYSEYLTENVQTYHALMCLGASEDIEVEAIMIDDTNLSHFEDVEYELYGPNHKDLADLYLLHPNVVNMAEIADNELLRGQYTGPFAVCGPGETLVAMKYDVFASAGLYYANTDGSITEKTLSWFTEVRRIDNNNIAVGGWVLAGFETWTAATTTPTRRTYTVNLPDAGRWEIRWSRQDDKDTNARAGHTMKLTGCRGYLQFAPPDPTCTYLALRMKATAQLSGVSQRKFAVVIRRLLKTWHPDTGWSAEPVYTRNPAWALADVLKNTKYGARLNDNRIDLKTLYDLSVTWGDRGDEFNGIFDKRITVWAALTTIARVGRTRPIMRGSVFTFVRDEKQDLPVALFTMRNIERNSFHSTHALRTDDEVDGVIVEYFDDVAWKPTPVLIPAPGVDVNDVISPQTINITGISNEAQATREGLYIMADSTYRRTSINFVTEMEGYLPAFGDLIAVSHDLLGGTGTPTGGGISGEVEEYNRDDDEIIVTEDIPWGDGNFYVLLNGPYGDVFGPYRVVPGSEDRSMKFLDDVSPQVEISDGTERERTRYAFGPSGAYSKLCKIVSITPQDARRVQISCVVEDNRVHDADKDVPPKPDEGGLGNGRYGFYAPDDLPPYDEASDEQRATWAYFSNESTNTVGSNGDPAYVYTP